MTTHSVGIFGLEYVLMLGGLYAALVVLALLARGFRLMLTRHGRVDGGDPTRTGTTARTVP